MGVALSAEEELPIIAMKISFRLRASPSLPPITGQPIRLAEYDEQARFAAWRCGVNRPASVLDADPQVDDANYPSPSFVTASDSHNEIVGQIRARQALPPKGCQKVGAECFAGHMGPLDISEDRGPGTGPRPHSDFQTVTWLIYGQVLHRNSLGSEQVIAPGQLNLVIAGRVKPPSRPKAPDTG